MNINSSVDNAIEVDFKELCRLCANPGGQDIMISIFGRYGIKIQLLEKINRHLPINVSKGDGLPDKVCVPCSSRLNVCDLLVQTCFEAEARLQALKNQLDLDSANVSSLLPIQSTNLKCDNIIQSSLTQNNILNQVPVPNDLRDQDGSMVKKEKTVEVAGDSQVSVILAEKDEQSDNSQKFNFVLVNIPKDDTYYDVQFSNRNEVAMKDSEELDLESNLDDNQLQQVIAEAELIQMQAAERFLRTLEENIELPGQAKLDATKTSQSQSGRVKNPPRKLPESSDEDPPPTSVRRSRRRRVRNKLYDSDSEVISNTFDCKICKKVFINASGLKLHKKKKSHQLQLERLYCLTCSVKFDDVSTAEDHECNITCNFLCEFCDQVFYTPQEADFHKLQHSNGPFTCAICNELFANLAVLQDHIIQHTKDSRPYQCNFCGKMFKSKLGLNGHQIRHTNNRTFLCYICHVSFLSREEMIVHRLSHSKEEKESAQTRRGKVAFPMKRFPCEVCGKSLTSKAGLIVHLRIHKGEKPFECDQCGRRFRQAIKLRYHQRLHIGDLPYVCTICEKRFNTQRQMDTHLRVHTNERPYICEICGMRFRSNGVLGRHKNTHSEEPLFSCAFCGKRFRTRHATTVHERTHTGEKRFMCDICGRSFAQKTTLDKHRLRHEKQRVECIECNTTFVSRKGLRRHFERKHTSASVVMDSIPILDAAPGEYVSVPMDELVVEVVV